MSLENKIKCCFRGCFEVNVPPNLPIEVYSLERGTTIFWAHEKCFESRLDPSVLPQKKHGYNIKPQKASCIFCGMKLPIFGKHGFCFDAGKYNPPHRYWAHNECMKASIRVNIKNKLPF